MILKYFEVKKSFFAKNPKNFVKPTKNIKFSALYYVTGPNRRNLVQKVQKKSWKFWFNSILVVEEVFAFIK